MKRFKLLFFALAPLCLSAPQDLFANCESCVLPRVGREGAFDKRDSDKRFFFDAKFEYHNWDSVSQSVQDGGHEEQEEDGEHEQESGHGNEDGHGGESHEHVAKHAGHDHGEAHSHNRVSDRMVHLSLGYHLSESVTVYGQVPYVERREVRGDSVQSSEGFGDLSLHTIWRALGCEDWSLGLIGGVKFPTASTNERDSSGELFSPETQPGTGSIDYSIGALFEYELDPVLIRGNALRIIRGNSDNSYEFGDTTTMALFVDVPVAKWSENKLFLGLDSNLQIGDRDTASNSPVRSSGGEILLVGPNITWKSQGGTSVNFAYLLPAYQDRGGDHQDLDSVLFLGARQNF